MNQKKILIVDDDADIALIIKDNMELDGYLVEVSSNGKRALAILNGDRFDLVMLDLSLPDVLQIQVTAKIFHLRNLTMFLFC